LSRWRLVVTVCDFCRYATYYADLNGLARLGADVSQQARIALKTGVAVTIDDDDLSVVLDDEDTKAIAALTAADVAAIDAAILSKLSSHWQKTALVIAISMYAYPDRYDDIPDVYYGQRVLALAQQGLLEASGDLRKWRFSEVRATSA